MNTRIMRKQKKVAMCVTKEEKPFTHNRIKTILRYIKKYNEYVCNSLDCRGINIDGEYSDKSKRYSIYVDLLKNPDDNAGNVTIKVVPYSEIVEINQLLNIAEVWL